MQTISKRMSIILIGMPGSGKTTLGRLIANKTQMTFVDTDQLIEEKCKSTLQCYLDKYGYLRLRQLEEKLILERDFQNTVVATGGSVVYSAKAINHLKTFGTVVYLNVCEDELLKRIDNINSRGIACESGQSFHSLFQERQALYEQYSDIEQDLKNKTVAQSLQAILNKLSKSNYQLMPQ